MRLASSGNIGLLAVFTARFDSCAKDPPANAIIKSTATTVLFFIAPSCRQMNPKAIIARPLPVLVTKIHTASQLDKLFNLMYLREKSALILWGFGFLSVSQASGFRSRNRNLRRNAEADSETFSSLTQIETSKYF
jgi:hypothetical protein